MSTHPGQGGMPAPCPRCTGLGDAHYLTCPTLRLPYVVVKITARITRALEADVPP